MVALRNRRIYNQQLLCPPKPSGTGLSAQGTSILGLCTGVTPSSFAWPKISPGQRNMNISKISSVACESTSKKNHVASASTRSDLSSKETNPSLSDLQPAKPITSLFFLPPAPAFNDTGSDSESPLDQTSVVSPSTDSSGKLWPPPKRPASQVWSLGLIMKHSARGSVRLISALRYLNGAAVPLEGLL